MEKKPFFDGFTPSEKQEVTQALDRVQAIRDAYADMRLVAERAESNTLASSDPNATLERSQAIAAASASRSALYVELADYADKTAMTPTSRTGAARFVEQLHLARLGDTAALATVQRAKTELGEAERAKADAARPGKVSVVAAGDRPLDPQEQARRPEPVDWAAEQANRRTAEAAAKQSSASNVVEVVGAAAGLATALPAHFKNRYIRVGQTIVDANAPARVLLSDKGKRLDAPEAPTSETITAMVDIAQARGWKNLDVSGSKEFRAAMYLEASSRGITVSGYKPNRQEQDIAVAAAERRRQTEADAAARAARDRDQKTLDAATDARKPGAAVADIFLKARSKEDRKDALRDHPELRNAFAMEAAAFQVSSRLRNKEAGTAFVQRFRDLIATDLANGQQLPDVARNARERREQDVSQTRSR